MVTPANTNPHISTTIKAIIGLGNPGHEYYYTRHSIGFRIIDQLAENMGSSWNTNEKLSWCTIASNNTTILLIKPQTYMNNSGDALPFLQKKGIKPEEIIVIHDELELPFGATALKFGGSARGHNGLKSIIAHIGDSFSRLRFGIGRPAQREDVPHYVLAPFSEKTELVNEKINASIIFLIDFLNK
jgi:PTH1 family peptidyl-tRNA hydrolase